MAGTSLREQLRQKNNIQQADMNSTSPAKKKAANLIDVVREEQADPVEAPAVNEEPQKTSTVTKPSKAAAKPKSDVTDLFPAIVSKKKRDKSARSIYFSDELYERIKKYAKAKNRTPSEIINDVCKWYMDEIATYDTK